MSKKKNGRNRILTEFKPNPSRSKPPPPHSKRPTDLLTFAHEFTTGVLKDAPYASSEGAKDLVEQGYAVCVLVWDISLEAQTYEKSLDYINVVTEDMAGPCESTPMKYLLLRALRMIFGLSISDEKMESSLKKILSPEELEFFNSEPTDDEPYIDFNGEIPF